MFIPLKDVEMLVKANELQGIKPLDSKKMRLPIGTISCRMKSTNEILFQTCLESKGKDVFWNGEGDGLYYRFVPKVVLSFNHDRSIKSLIINSKVILLTDVTLAINWI